jgi:hypothetical protein
MKTEEEFKELQDRLIRSTNKCNEQLWEIRRLLIRSKDLDNIKKILDYPGLCTVTIET